MNGRTTKYYFYEDKGSGTITIPVSIAQALGWKHKDNIELVIEVMNGNKGLFLYKKPKS